MRNATLPLSTFCFLLSALHGSAGIVLHAFSSPIAETNLDGANPMAGVAALGNLLSGTTANGGRYGAGTIFYLNADAGSFNPIRSFTNAPDAANPQGELMVASGEIFGASLGGGANGTGAIFRSATNASGLLLRSFANLSSDNAANSGGASPGAVILSGGTLYGTTSAGGAFANGTVFSLTTNGSSFSVLHQFSALDSGAGTNADGATPWGGLVQVGNTLYGTTSAGGAGGSGTIFSIATNGSTFATLHSFASISPVSGTNADGAIPFAGLVFSAGALYGAASAGGSGGRGTIFSIKTNGLGFTVLHHFTATDPATGTNLDGASPCASLLLSSNILYGTASAGGTGAAGTVFSLSANGAQFNVIHNFTMLASNGTNADGAFPVAPLLLVGNSLYGTAFSGGSGAAGVVFGIPLPAPPALITNIVNNGNGTVTLYFIGSPSSTNVIQSTTNLAQPIAWHDVSTNVADTNGAWQFTDINVNTSRFYRSYAR